LKVKIVVIFIAKNGGLYRIFVKVVESGDFFEVPVTAVTEKQLQRSHISTRWGFVGTRASYWTGGEIRYPPQPAALRGFRHRE